MRYQVLRAVHAKSLHLICLEDGFDALPIEVRHRGPWSVIKRGDMANLAPQYAGEIERQGHALEDVPIGLFSPET